MDYFYEDPATPERVKELTTKYLEGFSMKDPAESVAEQEEEKKEQIEPPSFDQADWIFDAEYPKGKKLPKLLQYGKKSPDERTIFIKSIAKEHKSIADDIKRLQEIGLAKMTEEQKLLANEL